MIFSITYFHLMIGILSSILFLEYPLVHSRFYFLGYCDPGYVSKTGLTPCFPCPRGTYQPDSGRSFCYECLRGATTSSIASTDVGSCIGINYLYRHIVRKHLYVEDLFTTSYPIVKPFANPSLTSFARVFYVRGIFIELFKRGNCCSYFSNA